MVFDLNLRPGLSRGDRPGCACPPLAAAHKDYEEERKYAHYTQNRPEVDGRWRCRFSFSGYLG